MTATEQEIADANAAMERTARKFARYASAAAEGFRRVADSLNAYARELAAQNRPPVPAPPYRGIGSILGKALVVVKSDTDSPRYVAQRLRKEMPS